MPRENSPSVECSSVAPSPVLPNTIPCIISLLHHTQSFVATYSPKHDSLAPCTIGARRTCCNLKWRYCCCASPKSSACQDRVCEGHLSEGVANLGWSNGFSSWIQHADVSSCRPAAEDLAEFTHRRAFKLGYRMVVVSLVAVVPLRITDSWIGEPPC